MPAPSPHTPLGDGQEFDAVRTLIAGWGARARGIGDDAAVLEPATGARLVASTDISAEGVHFRREWFTPAEIGWRAATSALSDLAAMAARPLGLLLAASVPERWRASLAEIGAGVGDAAAAVGCPIVGGDLSAGSDLVLTVTVLGEAEHPITRAGARPGDLLFVTGRLGGPRRALGALLAGERPSLPDRERFARPAARVAEAAWLAERGVRALIDISDGLLADARHMGAASGHALSIDPQLVRGVEGATLADMLGGGEEYELLCATPAQLDVHGFERTFNVPLTRIGTVVDAIDDRRVLVAGVARVDLPVGYDHFTR